MNGYDWKVHAACVTCGSSEQAVGPAEFVRGKTEDFLRDHDRHEYTLVQAIERPADPLDEAVGLPDFMRTIEVR